MYQRNHVIMVTNGLIVANNNRNKHGWRNGNNAAIMALPATGASLQHLAYIGRHLARQRSITANRQLINVTIVMANNMCSVTPPSVAIRNHVNVSVTAYRNVAIVIT